MGSRGCYEVVAYCLTWRRQKIFVYSSLFINSSADNGLLLDIFLCLIAGKVGIELVCITLCNFNGFSSDWGSNEAIFFAENVHFFVGDSSVAKLKALILHIYSGTIPVSGGSEGVLLVMLGSRVLYFWTTGNFVFLINSGSWFSREVTLCRGLWDFLTLNLNLK